MTVKLGIIGAGRIGRLHANILTTRVPGAQVLAIADIFESAASAAAADYGIRDHTSDPGEIINSGDIDAVVICSSTDTHCQFITEAARAGKSIFCEKPIAFDLAEIDAALNAVDEAGVQLQIGFNRRFDANHARIKRAIDSGEIGAPHTMTIISRDPAPPPIDYIKVSGGLMMDMMIHDFDMARFLLGEVDEVFALADVMVDPAIGAAGDIDTAKVMLRFQNGVIGTIENSRQAVYGYDQRVEVFGSGGGQPAVATGIPTPSRLAMPGASAKTCRFISSSSVTSKVMWSRCAPSSRQLRLASPCQSWAMTGARQ